MPLIQHVYPWDSQPQEAVEVDWSNPITVGLRQGVFAAPFRNATSLNAVSFNSAIQSVGPGFLGLSLGGSSGYLTAPVNAGTTPWTLLTYAFTPTGSGAAKAIVTHAEFPSANTMDRALAIGNDGSIVAYNYDGAEKHATFGVVSAGVPFVAAATCDGAQLTAWLNGSSGAGTAVSNAGHNGYSSPELVVGWGGGGALLGLGSQIGSNVVIAYVLKYDRVLTHAEMRSLSANPWQIFAPLTQYIPTSSGVPMPTLGIPTFVPGSLTSGGFRPRFPVTWA